MTQRQQDTLTLGRLRAERDLEPDFGADFGPVLGPVLGPGFGGWVGTVLLLFFLHR